MLGVFIRLAVGCVSVLGFGACLDPLHGTLAESAPDAAVDVMRESTQGFFDIAINARTPPGVREVCYDVRVSDGSAEDAVVWAAGDPSGAGGAWRRGHPPGSQGSSLANGEPLCSSQRGNGGGGDVGYVGPCRDNEPDHTVTVWVHAVVFDDAVPLAERNWVNPCTPSTVGGAPENWTGGCEVAARCAKDRDVPIAFALDLRPRAER